MTEKIRRQRETQQEQDGHQGWTSGIDSQGPGERGDSWQHFDTRKARSTLLLNKTLSCRQRGGWVTGEERGADTEREREEAH